MAEHDAVVKHHNTGHNGRKLSRRIGRVRLCGLAAILLTFVLVPAIHAVPVGISSKDATVLVNPDGSAVIIDRLRLEQSVKIFQTDLRVVKQDTIGKRQLFVDLLSVADVSNALAERPLKCEERNRGEFLRVECPTSATADVKITYGVRNAVEFFGAHDEFLYATGGGSSSTTVRIVLPPETKGHFQAQSFLRARTKSVPGFALWSSDGKLPVQIEDSTISASAPGPLVPGVEMVTNVFLDKGVVTPPSPLVRAGWFVRANPIVLMPLFGLLFMLILRRIKGHGAPADRSVAPIYSPPEGLSPAEAGVLIDDSFDARDIGATLVDLAVRGYLRIEECEPEEGLVSDRRDFILRLLKPQSEWLSMLRYVHILKNATAEGVGPSAPSAEPPSLLPHEEATLYHTFYGGHWTKLSSLRVRFPEIAPEIRALVMAALREKNMYRVEPQQAQGWRMVSVIGFAVLLLLAQITGVVSVFSSTWLGALMIALTAAIVFLLGRRLTAKTYRGMRTYIALLGLEEFISTVDAERLNKMEPNTFEKLLPYAIALGVEHRWTGHFDGLTTAIPDWCSFGDNSHLDWRTMGIYLQTLTFNPAVNSLPCNLRGRTGPREDAAVKANSARA